MRPPTRLFYITLALFFSVQGHATQPSVTTIAGSDSGYADGAAGKALFGKPFGLAVRGDVIFIADAGNNCVRKMDTHGNVTTIAGTTKPGLKDGPAGEAAFYSPTGLCFDRSGNCYIVDFLNQAIRKLDPEGYVTTLAGNNKIGYQDGKGDEVAFNFPRGIVINSKNELFVSDSWNHRVRKITLDGTVTTYAGGGKITDAKGGGENQSTFLDGPVATARLGTICGMSIDKDDNIYIADASNHRIRKISSGGVVSTIAGNGEKGLTDGDALSSRINTPTEVFAAPNGEVFFSDTYNNVVRKVTREGKLVTLAGTGKKGFKDGPAAEALLDFPRGIVTTHTVSKVFFVDHNNSRLRAIDLER